MSRALPGLVIGLSKNTMTINKLEGIYRSNYHKQFMEFHRHQIVSPDDLSEIQSMISGALSCGRKVYLVFGSNLSVISQSWVEFACWASQNGVPFHRMICILMRGDKRELSGVQYIERVLDGKRLVSAMLSAFSAQQ